MRSDPLPDADGFERMAQLFEEVAEDLRRIATKLRRVPRARPSSSSRIVQTIGSGGADPSPPRPNSKKRHQQGSPRMKQLKTFLAEHGPKGRAEIVRETKIPLGTVGTLLKPENGFRQTGSGKWGLKPEKTEESP